MPPTTLLWDLDPHTEAKHRIYRRYLQAWFPILLSHGDGVTYAEGFAGPGEYTCRSPGSPIWAVRALLRSDRQPTAEAPAYILLVDENKARCAHLNGMLETELGTLDPTALLRRGLVVDVQPGRCNETIPAMFHQHRVSSRPLLAIFDTWGSAVAFDLLRRVAVTPRAETIVTIQPSQFTRFASDPKHYGDHVFGSYLWRDVQKQPANTKAAYLQTQYRRTLRDAGFRFVLDFELADEGGHLLHLVYGTNHPKGTEKIKDAMWSVDAVHGVGYRDPRDPNQQMLEIKLEPQTAPLRRLILDHLRTRPGQRATLADVRDFALQETIYKATHAQTVVRELLTADQLRRTTAGRLNGTSIVELVPAAPLIDT